MSVTKEDVRHIAHLARLGIDEERLEPMTDQLNQILDWIEQLEEVDTEGVQPMTSAVETALHRRADEVTDGDRQSEILANAPAAKYGFFTVPKVIE